MQTHDTDKGAPPAPAQSELGDDDPGLGLAVLDAGGRLLAATPLARQLGGYAVVSGQDMHDPRYEPTDTDGQPVPAAEIRALAAGPARENQTVAIVGEDGVRRWLDVSALPVPGDEGRPALLVVGVRPHGGDPMLGRTAFAVAPPALALVGIDGRIRAANRALHDLLGRDDGELVGVQVGELAASADRAAAADLLHPERPPQLTLRLDDGRTVVVRRSLLPGPDGAPAHAVLHLLPAHREAEARVAALERANAELSEFASRAAHDLKAPLAAISGLCGTLAHRADLLSDEEQADLLARVVAIADRATALVHELLAEAQTAQTYATSVPDPRAIADAVVAASPVAVGEVELTGEWPALGVRPGDVRTIVSNLVENAHFYGRDPGGRLRARLDGQRADGVFVLVYADDGAGFGPDPGWVFDEFRRGAESRRANPESTGLGLALVRRIVQRAGGTIAAGSTASGGAMVRLTLPLAPG